MFPDHCQDVTVAILTLSRCYLRSHLVRNTAGALKEPSNKYTRAIFED